MNSEEIIYLKLSSLRRRWKLFESLRLSLEGFFLGVIISMSLLVTGKFFYIYIAYELLFVVPLVTLFIFFFIGITRRMLLRDMAFLLDFRAGFEERIGTALEMIEGKVSSPMITALIEDASGFVSKIDPSEIITFQFPIKIVIVMTSILLLLTGIFFIPYNFKEESSREFKALLGKEGKELEDYSEEIKKFNYRGDIKLSKEIEKDFKELSRKLQKGDLNKKEALLELASLEQKLKDKEKTLKNSNLNIKEAISGKLSKSLEDISKELSKKTKNDSLSDKEKSEVAKKLDELLKNMSEGNSLKKDMEELSRALKSGNSQEIHQAMEKLSESIKKNESQLMEESLSKLKECEKEISGFQ
ncbi:MAG TPA: hypothetical protein PL110_05485 [Candidatus Eremiobacteraeota bacterium]|nr:MAG: hypothetical protein BWY64_03340 [bacterium ADurb.Bin363]HPZ07544.1 hypothetical protein [Candidatus Eremiobacteraeota bacterium]